MAVVAVSALAQAVVRFDMGGVRHLALRGDALQEADCNSAGVAGVVYITA